MANPTPLQSVPNMQEQFDAVDAQIARRQRARVDTAEASARAGGVAEFADQLVRAQKKYGSYLSPSMIHGLITKVGLDPDDPAFDGVAKLSAKSGGGGGLGMIGSVIKRGVRDTLGAPSAVLRQADDHTGGHLKGAMDLAVSVPKAEIRLGLLAAGSGVQEAEGAFRNVAAWKPGGVPVGAAIAGGVAAAGLAASAPVDIAGLALGGTVAAGAALGGLGGTKIEGKGHWEFQSDGAIAAQRALSGQKVNLGTGLLPDVGGQRADGSEIDPTSIGAEQRRRARRVNIGGSAVTPGRLLAAGVVEPGSKPYSVLSGLVDADLNWHYDPAQLLGSRVGNYRRNGKLFTEGAEAFSVQGAKDFVTAGGLFSHRAVTDPAKASAWLDGAIDLKDKIAANGDFLDLYERTGRKLGVDLTDKLAKAKTADEVDALLRPELGVNNALRGPLNVDAGARVPFTTYRPFENARFTKTLPGRNVSLRDRDQRVATIVDFLHNVKMPRSVIAEHAQAMADAEGGAGIYKATEQAVGAVHSKLIADGWDPKRAHELTSMVTDAAEETRGYWIDEVGRPRSVAGMYLGDEAKVAATTVAADPGRVLYHGSTDISEGLRPVDLKASGPVSNLGPGFYVTDSEAVALRHAAGEPAPGSAGVLREGSGVHRLQEVGAPLKTINVDTTIPDDAAAVVRGFAERALPGEGLPGGEEAAALRRMLRGQVDGVAPEAVIGELQGLGYEGVEAVARSGEGGMETALWSTDRLAAPGSRTGPVTAGTGKRIDLPSPHLPTEFANNAIPLPGIRDLRAATSVWAPILKFNGANDIRKLGVSVADELQGHIWKRAQLLRGAYTVRVIAEEQARMAAVGLDSLLQHPMSLISHRLSTDSAIGRAAEKLGVDVGKGGIDVVGEKFSAVQGEALNESMRAFSESQNKTYQMAGWADGKRPVGRIVFNKGNARFDDVWASEVNKLAHDPVAAEVARNLDDLDSVKAAFKGGGATKIADAENEMEHARLYMAQDAEGLHDLDVADDYIQSVAERIHYTTGGDPDLIKAIGEQRIKGASLNRGLGNSPELKAHLNSIMDKAPDRLMGDLTITERGLGLMRKYDRATDWMFSKLMAERTNNLSRSPAFKQFYWQRIEELAPYSDDATRAEMIAQAREAKLPDVADRIAKLPASAPSEIIGPEKGYMRMYRGDGAANADLAAGAAPSEARGLYFSPNRTYAESFATAEGDVRYVDVPIEVPRALDRSGLNHVLPQEWADQAKLVAHLPETAPKLDLFGADTIAKGFGLDQTKALLYDATEKGQFFDAHRIIFPFGEAWKELITRWGKIGVEHPEAIRKIDQVITGARGSGFFHKDANGNEVFSYPASGWISNKMFGVPIPLTGKVAGLSIMTDVMPGVGPVATMAAGSFIPDKPNWDWAKNALFPFGEPDTSHGLVESFLPSWLSKLKDGGYLRFMGLAQNDAAFQSTVMDTARYLASTGEYNTGDPDDITRMLADARQKSKSLYLLRAAAQFFSPTAPTPSPKVQTVTTEQGKTAVHLAAVDVLVKEYHDLLDNPETRDSATETMLTKYGDGIEMVLQGKTAATVAGLPGSSDAANWEKTNGAAVKSHPNVWGFFAPQGGDLDPAAYSRQVEEGQRVRLTPEQMVRQGNARVAAMQYADAKGQVGEKPTAAQRAWLAELKAALVHDYPGYGDTNGIAQTASTSTLISNLRDAVGDKRLASEPVTGAVKSYLEARDQASAAAKSAGLSATGFQSAKKMASTRAWLRQIGEALSQETPEFATVWEQVFSRELADDALPVTTEGG